MRSPNAHQAIVLERHELGVLSEATNNAAQSDTATAADADADDAATTAAAATANADTNDAAAAAATTASSYAAQAARSAAAAASMLHTAGMILEQSLLQAQQSAHQIRTQLVHAQLARLAAGAGRCR